MKRPDTPLAATPLKNSKGTISVDVKSRSTNKNRGSNGNYTSITTRNIETDDSKMVSQNKVKGDKGKYRSASLTRNADGTVSGNFVKGEKGKYLTGDRAERKFSRVSNRMNRQK